MVLRIRALKQRRVRCIVLCLWIPFIRFYTMLLSSLSLACSKMALSLYCQYLLHRFSSLRMRCLTGNQFLNSYLISILIFISRRMPRIRSGFLILLLILTLRWDLAEYFSYFLLNSYYRRMS